MRVAQTGVGGLSAHELGMVVVTGGVRFARLVAGLGDLAASTASGGAL